MSSLNNKNERTKPNTINDRFKTPCSTFGMIWDKSDFGLLFIDICSASHFPQLTFIIPLL